MRQCKHCKMAFKERVGRGLCRKCWNDEGIRNLYPPVSTQPGPNEATPTARLSLAEVRKDGGTRLRKELNEATVLHYKELLANGVKLPRPVAFHDGDNIWLAAGFHRVAAGERLDWTEMDFEVRNGSRDDALWYAFGSNAEHGLPLSQDEKQQAIIAALKLRPKESDRAIAEHLGASNKTVAKYRQQLETGGEIPHLSNRIGKDGKAYDNSSVTPAPHPEDEQPQEDTPIDDSPPDEDVPDFSEVPEESFPSARAEGYPTEEVPDLDTDPALQSHFCQRCQRVGECKGCPDCAALRGRAPKPSPQQPARPAVEKYDWRVFEANFGVVARMPNAIARLHPEEARSTEYHAADRLLDEFCTLWTQWKKRLTGKKE